MRPNERWKGSEPSSGGGALTGNVKRSFGSDNNQKLLRTCYAGINKLPFKECVLRVMQR